MGVGGLKEKKLGNRQCQEGVTKEFPVSPSRTGRQVIKRGLAGEEYGISEPSELIQGQGSIGRVMDNGDQDLELTFQRWHHPCQCSSTVGASALAELWI